MDEFSLIKKYLAPLAKNYNGALNLTDDAALISVPAGYELAITKDAISQGVHFMGDEAPDLIAKKLLRVNLSDLAAMGAKPLVYFLALMLPKSTPEKFLADFAKGLAQDQKEFGITLAGGDTIATKGALSFSITALGLVKKGTSLKRSGAKPGDGVYVSGTLGDSALGLMLCHSERSRKAAQSKNLCQDHSASPQDDSFLKNRYLLPQPRSTLGQKLLGIASAAIDISDGLLQDLGHICETSGVGAIIEREKLPLSSPTKKLITHDPKLWNAVLSGGDDYELLFTAPKSKAATLKNLGVTEIGHMVKDSGVTLLAGGKKLAVKQKGFRHF